MQGDCVNHEKKLSAEIIDYNKSNVLIYVIS